MSLSPTEVEQCIALLTRARELDPNGPAHLAIEQAAAGLRKSAKQRRKKQRRHDTSAHDREIRAAVLEQRSGPQPFDPPPFKREQECYVCRQSYRQVHAHYHLMCQACGELCREKREAKPELSGRRALVTGGRIKIGFAVALRLLRAGAHVTITTRFPCDAVQRFKGQSDFAAFSERLCVVAADFRWLAALLEQIDLWNAGPAFDIVINNAAQTVWRPPEYYQELRRREHETQNPEPWIQAALPVIRDPGASEHGLTQHAISALFPAGQVDTYGNQLDLRRQNSWVQRLAQVHPIDFVESQLVNAMAPFLLCSRLKPSLLRSAHADRYIINVSAVEGMFSRPHKPTRHPHTNMAKAALNMLTRTSAADYARDGIYMSSVDPGWMSHEVPQREIERRKGRGLHPPLDAHDSAARVCDPIASGIAGQPLFGVLLKDFREVPW